MLKIQDFSLMVLDEKSFFSYKVREPQSGQNNFVVSEKSEQPILVVFSQEMSQQIFQKFEQIGFDDFDQELSGSDEMDIVSDDTQEELKKIQQNINNNDSIVMVN